MRACLSVAISRLQRSSRYMNTMLLTSVKRLLDWGRMEIKNFKRQHKFDDMTLQMSMRMRRGLVPRPMRNHAVPYDA